MLGKGKKSPVNKQVATVIKTSVATAGVAASSLDRVQQQLTSVRSISGALDPPYDPKSLIRLCEMSSVLPQHIDAIVTNVDSYGHKFVPAIDLTSSTAKDALKEAMISEAYEHSAPDADIPEPKKKEIDDKFKKVKQRAQVELNTLNTFYASCCPDYSFIDFRSRVRIDERITGNAYVELIRDAKGRPSRFCLASAMAMRLLLRDTTPTTVQENVRISPISWTKVAQQRYFRRFAEVDTVKNTIITYFKEYGDPRVLSRKTGKFYKDVAAFNNDPKKVENDSPATEIIHFTIPNSATPYGVPQWIGNLPAILGSRELDEVNLAYFENKTVPPLALLVNGGRLSRGVVPRIEEFIEQQVKGKKNFHKILILEAEGQKSVAGTSGIVPTMKFVPLRSSQQQDALFQEYDEKNWDKVASSFRLPRILIGRDRAINRATAIAAIRFAEEQVFAPIRNKFDEFMNRRILPELGVFFWRFESNTPITRDPEMLAEIISTLSDCGTLTPAEGRQLATNVFNHQLPNIDEPWVHQPMKLTIAELKVKSGDTSPQDPKNTGLKDKLNAEGQTTDDNVVGKPNSKNKNPDTAGNETMDIEPLAEE